MFWDNYVRLCNSVNKSPSALAVERHWASSAAVTGWKKGANPRAGVLSKIADHFGVTVEYLTGEPEGPVPLDVRPAGTVSHTQSDYHPFTTLPDHPQQYAVVVKSQPTRLGELNEKYFDLTAENQAMVDSLIEKLLRSQSAD